MTEPSSELRGDGPIVMVDDNESDAFIAKRCHARSRLQNPLLVISGGSAFLAHLEQVEAGHEPLPALVLLDINMPDMDGFKVLEHVRSRESFRELPVIMMLTNSDRPRDVERAMTLGANGFQLKPPDLESYVAFFDSLLPS